MLLANLTGHSYKRGTQEGGEKGVVLMVSMDSTARLYLKKQTKNIMVSALNTYTKKKKKKKGEKPQLKILTKAQICAADWMEAGAPQTPF